VVDGGEQGLLTEARAVEVAVQARGQHLPGHWRVEEEQQTSWRRATEVDGFVRAGGRRRRHSVASDSRLVRVTIERERVQLQLRLLK
jgi:hypothetical protein